MTLTLLRTPAAISPEVATAHRIALAATRAEVRDLRHAVLRALVDEDFLRVADLGRELAAKAAARDRRAERMAAHGIDTDMENER